MGCIFSNRDIQYQSFNFSGLNEFIKNTIIMKVSCNPWDMRSKSITILSAFSNQVISYLFYFFLLEKNNTLIACVHQKSSYIILFFFGLFLIVVEPVEKLKLVLGNACCAKLYPDDISPEDFKIHKLMMSNWTLNLESLILFNGKTRWL